MEVVARCLRVLESNRDVIELRLVEVLRAMVRFQACFLKPMKPRPRLFKRGKVDEKKTVKNELPGISFGELVFLAATFCRSIVVYICSDLC